MPRTHRRTTLSAAALLVSLGGLAACEPAPPPTAFTVNVESGRDVNPGDGVCEVVAGSGDCSLEAAVQEGNALGGPIQITVSPAFHGREIRGPGRITTTTTIDAGGAWVSGRFVHTAGELTLRDLNVLAHDAGDSCGSAVNSTGDAVLVEQMYVEGGRSTAPGSAVCTTGMLVLRRTEISDSSGPGASVTAPNLWLESSAVIDAVQVPTGGTLVILNSLVPKVDAPGAVGAVQFSWVAGHVGPGLRAAGSLLECAGSSSVTSDGYNIDAAGRCGADGPGDLVEPVLPPSFPDVSRGAPVTFAPPVASPVIGAIPAGTPRLCDGTGPADRFGTPRGPGRPCDIGPVQTQFEVAVHGSGERRAVAGGGFVVNTSGTVAASFLDPDTGVPAVGRWEPDGTVTSSGHPNTAVIAIADNGTVVGTKQIGNVTATWRWKPDMAPEVVTGLPGGASARVLGIADDGTIVGESPVADVAELWALSPDGTTTALDGSRYGTVRAITDGKVIGSRVAAGQPNPSAAVWDLRTGAVRDLPAAAPGLDPQDDAEAVAFGPDGRIYGRVGQAIVAWSPDDSVTIIAERAHHGLFAVVGEVAVAELLGSGVLGFFDDAAFDARHLDLPTWVHAISPAGYFVGTQTTGGITEVVRIPFTVSR